VKKIRHAADVDWFCVLCHGMVIISQSCESSSNSPPLRLVGGRGHNQISRCI
jgi:hypothetical protein